MIGIKMGKNIVSILKDSAGLPGSEICIPVGKPVTCFLRPIATNPNLLNKNDINNLTNWRNRYVSAFLTEFQATEERTANWLTEVVRHNDNKILFMLEDLHGVSFGYMGLDFIDWKNKYGEADAIVRGGHAPAGTMKLALQTLINWSREYLELSNLNVRVRSDNTAINFYQKAGFHETHRICLERNSKNNVVSWVETDRSDSNLSLVYMKYIQ
jgi:RimJ/RimL family protein N-acetyltransferase